MGGKTAVKTAEKNTNLCREKEFPLRMAQKGFKHSEISMVDVYDQNFVISRSPVLE